MTDFHLNACDLPFRNDILFTYEHDDGLSRSWIDHVLCSQSHSIIYAVHSGSILSDHSPLFFSIRLNSSPVQVPHSVTSKKS